MTTSTTSKKLTSKECMHLEHEHCAHNYHPLPVVFASASGAVVTDCEGRTYFDFLSAYSAVNQGHSHPELIKVMVDQASKLTLSSRAFYTNQLGPYAKYITEYFGYESVLPMNTGAEGVETALKLARRWGYMIKKIPTNEAVILSCKDNFHGRTLSIITMSTDPDTRGQFGPFTPGLDTIPYNDTTALSEYLEQFGKKVCGFLVEPIQGEAGVVVPDDGYLKTCKDLCKQHNVLFIADEIQTGLARTGKMLAIDHENVRADILILGKALSGGMYPISAVLADRSIMDCFTPGSHGSTYGGNPMSCAIAIRSLQILKEEKLCEKAEAAGKKLRAGLNDIAKSCTFIKLVRGKGLLNAIVLDPNFRLSGYQICLMFKKNGLLAKQTHSSIIRFAPPLVITDEQLDQCLAILKKVLTEAKTIDPKTVTEEWAIA